MSNKTNTVDWRERLFKVIAGVACAEGVIFEEWWDMPKSERDEILAEYEKWGMLPEQEDNSNER